MSMLYLDATDTTMRPRPGQRGVGRQQQTTAFLFSLDHIPTDSFKIFSSSTSGNRNPLAVVNLLDTEAVSIGKANYALVSNFAITASASPRM